MQDARYLRAQARLCLEIAGQMSDLKAAQKLKAEAATYHARADEIEHPERPTLSRASKDIEK